jgi:hypothetical protein
MKKRISLVPQKPTLAFDRNTLLKTMREEFEKLRAGVPQIEPSPDEDYVGFPTRNADGDSTEWRCSTIPDAADAIDEVLMLRILPWRKRSDFLRWAIKVALKLLQIVLKTHKDAKSLINLALQQADILNRIEAWLSLSKTFARVEQVIAQSEKDDGIEQALDDLEELIAAARRTAPDVRRAQNYQAKLARLREDYRKKKV